MFGQRKLLKWSVPGIAHFLTFWGFIILLLTIIEAYGDLFSKNFAIPGIGHWAVIGFLEDLFAVGGAGRHRHRSRSSGCATTRSGKAGSRGSPGRTPARPGSSCS